MEPMVKRPRLVALPNLLRTQPVQKRMRPQAWRIGKARPGDPGWASRATDRTLQPGSNGIVASVRSGGASAAVYAYRVVGDVSWGGATLSLFGIVGPMRILLAGPVGIPVGGTQVINLPNGCGGCDSLELEVAGAPPVPVAVPGNVVRVALVTWDGGSDFWDARFVDLLERIDSLAVACRELSKKG